MRKWSAVHFTADSEKPLCANKQAFDPLITTERANVTCCNCRWLLKHRPPASAPMSVEAK